ARRWRLAVLAAAVLEKLLEELLEGRAGRQLRHCVAAQIHGLLGRDIDDGVDDLLGNVGDAFGPTRGSRRYRPSNCANEQNGSRRTADMCRHTGKECAHGRRFSWEAVCRKVALSSRRFK